MLVRENLVWIQFHLWLKELQSVDLQYSGPTALLEHKPAEDENLTIGEEDCHGRQGCGLLVLSGSFR